MVAWGRWLAVTWVSAPPGQGAPGPTLAAPQVALFKLVSALILLTIGGVSLIVLAWLALRVGRRSADRPVLRATHRTGLPPDDWAHKPLAAHGEDTQDEPDGP